MLIDFDKLVWTTHDTVNKLFQYKNGGDALMLYFRYIQQKKMQDTNITMSHDTFMMNATGWSKDKFYKVKKLLVDLWFIETVKRVNDKGKITGHYIKVNFVINIDETKTEEPKITETHTQESPKSGKTRVWKNQSLEKPESGKTETNASVKNINASVKKKNTTRAREEEKVRAVKSTETIETETALIESYRSKFSDTSQRYQFFSFLIQHLPYISQSIDTEKLETIDQKLIEFRELLGEPLARIEIESFIEHHRENRSEFKSIIGRLNTWLSKHLKKPWP